MANKAHQQTFQARSDGFPLLHASRHVRRNGVACRGRTRLPPTCADTPDALCYSAHHWQNRSFPLPFESRIMHGVIRSFRDQGTEDVFDGTQSVAARRTCPKSLWSVARRKLDQLNRVRDVRQLSIPPGNRLERLRGDRDEQYSIRINTQYRVCFRWEAGDAYKVEIADYH